MAKKIGFLLFPGFEVLDVYGPLSIFASPKLQGAYQVITIAEVAGPIEASNGISTLASESINTCPPLDVLLVPGVPPDSSIIVKTHWRNQHEVKLLEPGNPIFRARVRECRYPAAVGPGTKSHALMHNCLLEDARNTELVRECS